MYKSRTFTENERCASLALRREAEMMEKILLHITPGRERSLALTKLEEVLLWAGVAIAEGGMTKEPKPEKQERQAEANCAPDMEAKVDVLIGKINACGVVYLAANKDSPELDTLRAELDGLENEFGNRCNSVNAKLVACRNLLGCKKQTFARVVDAAIRVEDCRIGRARQI